MRLLLKERDYVADGNGGLVTLEGGDEMINEVLFRLTARRGSFPFLPELGSDLYRLRGEKPSTWQSLARQYAAQALSGLADITVTGVSAARDGDSLSVEVTLLWKGTELTATARLEG